MECFQKNLTADGLDRGVIVRLFGSLGAGTSVALGSFVLGRLDRRRLFVGLAGEFLHATCGVDNLLLSSKEWVARAAQFDVDVLLGGAGLVRFSAGTLDGGCKVRWMDLCLHKGGLDCFVYSRLSAKRVTARGAFVKG